MIRGGLSRRVGLFVLSGRGAGSGFMVDKIISGNTGRMGVAALEGHDAGILAFLRSREQGRAADRRAEEPEAREGVDGA